MSTNERGWGWGLFFYVRARIICELIKNWPLVGGGSSGAN